jgi:stage II sporulation protein M
MTWWLKGMKLLIRCYVSEWGFFKSKLKSRFILIVALFLISTILFYFCFLQYPQGANLVTKNLSTQYQYKGVISAEGTVRSLNLFLMNLKISVLIGISGIIPFLFFPILVILLWGYAFVDAGSKGISIFNLFFFGILPHGIFELSAIFYSASIGTLIAFEISKKIIRRHPTQANSFPIFNIVKEAARSYIFVIIPLLVLASLIESYITLFIAKSFLLE